jgi:hypothetical protein
MEGKKLACKETPARHERSRGPVGRNEDEEISVW